MSEARQRNTSPENTGVGAQRFHQGLRRIAGEGSILVAGTVAGQLLALLRNAILGHWLSNGDFGIAAAITLMLQLLESLSDLGAERLILQADDGGKPHMMSAAHLIVIARGLLIAALMFAFAGPIATFFAVPEAAWAFQVAALVPLIKAFIHLDIRRRQRDLENRPYALLEVLPQAAALAVTMPILARVGDFSAVVWIALVQAVAMLAVSHAVARTAYRPTADFATLRRFVTFGWPIWLSAFPLVLVLQGDKLIIARYFTIEDLAAYSAVFMVTMTPALLFSKLAYPLLLPLFARNKADAQAFSTVYIWANAAMTAATLVYWAGFALIGGWLVAAVFGPGYQGLGAITTLLALMWALRIANAVPTVALMSVAATREIFYAGLIRSAPLVPALVFAQLGFGMDAIIWCGVAGEAASLAFVHWRARYHCPLGRPSSPPGLARPA